MPKNTVEEGSKINSLRNSRVKEGDLSPSIKSEKNFDKSETMNRNRQAQIL